MLAEKLHLPVDDVLDMDCNKIAEWMAYDMTKQEEFQDKHKQEQKDNMTPEQQVAMMKAQLGK